MSREQAGDFDEYRPIDVRKTSQAANGVTIDVNGTELLLKQRKSVPVIVEIYVEAEDEPIGAINVATGETVSLGGVSEQIGKDLTDTAADLRETADSLDRLAHRSNPTGTPTPDDAE